MYAMNQASQRYKQQGVLTANPVELIVMLYDGCIKQLKIAALQIEDKDYEGANESLLKAQRILLELINSLDLSYAIGGELMALYEFLLRHITQGNAAKDGRMLEEAASILKELRDSWAMLAKNGVGSVAQMED